MSIDDVISLGIFSYLGAVWFLIKFFALASDPEDE